MYHTLEEQNRKYDKLCFTVTAYILFGIGAAVYGNTHKDNISKLTINDRINSEAILVEDSKMIFKNHYYRIRPFRKI